MQLLRAEQLLGRPAGPQPGAQYLALGLRQSSGPVDRTWGSTEGRSETSEPAPEFSAGNGETEVRRERLVVELGVVLGLLNICFMVQGSVTLHHTPGETISGVQAALRRAGRVRRGMVTPQGFCTPVLSCVPGVQYKRCSLVLSLWSVVLRGEGDAAQIRGCDCKLGNDG